MFLVLKVYGSMYEYFSLLAQSIGNGKFFQAKLDLHHNQFDFQLLETLNYFIHIMAVHICGECCEENDFLVAFGESKSKNKNVKMSMNNKHCSFILPYSKF